MKFQIDITKIQNLYYVYKAENSAGLQYVGFVDGRNLFLVPDIVANRYIKAKLMLAPLLTVTVLSVHATERAARAEFTAQVQALRPPLNQYGRATMGGKRKRVRCVETGDAFASVTEAATSIDVAVTTMSNHLNRRRGYATIKGYSYEYAI